MTSLSKIEKLIVDLERAITAAPVSEFHDANIRKAARSALCDLFTDLIEERDAAREALRQEFE